METVGNMKLYTFEEVLDKQLGKKGTPRRDAHEMRVEEALHAYRIGEAIKKARLKQNLTQEELGEKVGVKRSQICKLENGKPFPRCVEFSKLWELQRPPLIWE